MKRICLGFATLLLSSSLIYGDEANRYSFDSARSAPAAQSASLTPKRAKSFTPISKGAIKQASLTAQLDSISNDSTFEGAPAIQEPPAGDFPAVLPELQPIAEPPVQTPLVEEIPAAMEYVPPQLEQEPVVTDPVVIDVPVVIDEPVAQPPVVQEPVTQVPVEQEPPTVKVEVIQVPQAAPAAEAAAPAQDLSFIYAEWEQFRNELTQIKKDIAKPDPKKGWSAPKFSGRIFLDSVNFMDSTVDRENAAGFRELRLGMAGTGYDSFDYKIEFGFEQNQGPVTLMDNWLGVKNVPLLGYFRAGYYKPEVGLYFPMGTTNVSMMEYVTASNVFGLNRRVGISSEHLFANDRVRLFIGLFQNSFDRADRNVTNDDQGQIFNLRLTMAPVFEQEGKRLLHFGGHWEYVNTENGRATLATKPGTYAWAANSLAALAFANDYSNRGGLEIAYQNGRFSARSEVFAGSFAGYNGEPQRNLNGAYVELGLFLTEGGFRTYDLKTGAFGAVKTKNNFHPYASGDWNLVDSLGALQAIFQWSYTDMNDWRTAYGTAGEQTDLVFGLNWFWSPQMRMMFEYVHSEQCTGTAHAHAAQDIFGTSLRYNW